MTAKRTAAPTDAGPPPAPAEGAVDEVQADSASAPEPEASLAAGPAVLVSTASPALLTYVGPIAMVVAGVGPCVPGRVYPVPESVAVDVCRGDSPLFVRVAPAV